MSLTALIVDDNRENLIVAGTMLKRHGFDVHVLQNAGRVIDRIGELRPDVVVLDIMMPGISGSSAYEEIRKRFAPDLPIVISTGTALSLKDGGDPFVAHCPKPLDEAVFLAVIRDMITRRQGPPQHHADDDSLDHEFMSGIADEADKLRDKNQGT